MSIDDRLRAAGRALKDSSVAQVDAASRLREILCHTGQLVAHGRPPEPPEPIAPSLLPQARPRRTPQRLALVVNLLLVLALGIVIGVAATYTRGANGDAPTNSGAPTASASTILATRTTVPDACVETAELADEVISRLNRNDRNNRLTALLRDYTIASQSCRRAASPYPPATAGRKPPRNG